MDLIEKLEMRENKRGSFKALLEGLDSSSIVFLTIAVTALIILNAGMFYVGLSKTIYFWDGATYWDITRALVSGELTGEGFWKTVFNSIGTLDYNYAAALPSALWMLIFGKSRVAFVAGLIVMYIVPIELLLFRITKKLSKAPLQAFLIALLIMPVLCFLAFNGFVDVGGVLICLACYNLYYTKHGICESWGRYAVIGVLLVVMMVFRRYFAFFAVSFVTMVAADCLINRRSWINTVMMVLVMAALLLTVFNSYFTNILLKDYGTMYSSYKFSIGTDFKLIFRYFGLLFILAAVAVPFGSVILNKDDRPAFLWIQVIVCMVMFMVTQTHGQQHLLLYVPTFMIMVIFMINCITKRWMFLALCGLTLLNVLSPHIVRNQPDNIQKIRGVAILPSFSMNSERRDDTDDIIAVKRALDTEIPEGSKCSVLASSFVINDSILRNAEVSLNETEYRSGDYIISVPAVDSRDADRLDELYNAEYMLVVIPAQTHLAPGQQTIVEEAVSSFENYTDIAQLFSRVDSFEQKIGDMDVRLYKRKMDIDQIRRKAFESRLFNTDSDI